MPVSCLQQPVNPRHNFDKSWCHLSIIRAQRNYQQWSVLHSFLLAMSLASFELSSRGSVGSGVFEAANLLFPSLRIVYNRWWIKSVDLLQLFESLLFCFHHLSQVSCQWDGWHINLVIKYLFQGDGWFRNVKKKKSLNQLI